MAATPVTTSISMGNYLAKSSAILCLAALLSGACAHAYAQTTAAPDDKAATRNNAASLLTDLLSQDKNVSKILIIKHNSPELGKLMKAISKTAGDDEQELETLAKNEPALKLHSMDLPPGEKAARASDAKTTEHELLSSSGATFEFRLLLSQAQAMNYGSHLAKVAADNAASPEETRVFHSLDAQLSGLYQQVIAMMHAHPAVK